MMIRQKSIAVIIPVHNRLEFTSRCIACLKAASTNVECHMVIIDDGSTDGTYNWLLKNEPDIICLKGDGHLWFGGATQLGLNYVKENLPNTDYVLMLNNDALILPTCIDALIRESQEQATVGALLVDEKQTKILDFGTYWHWWYGWFNRIRGKNLKDYPEIKRGTARHVDMLSTTCTIIPMKWIKHIKGIDVNHYLQHKADTNLLSQISKAGSPLKVSSFAIAIAVPNVSPLQYSIRGKSIIQFFKDTLFNKLYPVHLPTSILSIWETAPNCISAIVVIIRQIIIYIRQLVLCSILNIMRLFHD